MAHSCYGSCGTVHHAWYIVGGRRLYLIYESGHITKTIPVNSPELAD